MVSECLSPPSEKISRLNFRAEHVFSSSFLSLGIYVVPFPPINPLHPLPAGSVLILVSGSVLFNIYVSNTADAASDYVAVDANLMHARHDQFS